MDRIVIFGGQRAGKSRRQAWITEALRSNGVKVQEMGVGISGKIIKREGFLIQEIKLESASLITRDPYFDRFDLFSSEMSKYPVNYISWYKTPKRYPKNRKPFKHLKHKSKCKRKH